MTIDVLARIHRPIDEVWHLLADDFTSVQSWSDAVVTSEALTDVAAADGSPVAGRYCTFSDDPKGFGARETITKYDKDRFHLEFDIQPVNAPAALPIHRNHVAVTLRALRPSETEVRWVATPELKLHGYLLYPLVKLGMARSFRGILAELKTYAERGPSAQGQRPHLAMS